MRTLAALATLSIAVPLAHAGGSIRGAVKYLGTPKAAPPDRSSAPQCPAATASEDVVVAGGKLRDVHVRIASGTAGKHRAPAAPIVIEQTGCEYRPRVVGAMVGQKLEVRNADPLMHNVHGYAGETTAFNRGQPRGGKPIEHADLGAAGGVFTLKCDVHAWMRAHIPLTDHPFFAVTDADGAFALKGVPAGSYTVEAYHPTLGTKKKSVTVSEGGSATVDFIFP